MVRQLLILSAFFAAAVYPADNLNPAKFLIGRWAGDLYGDMGSTVASFSFTVDVQGRVLIGRSSSSYPANPRGPAYRRDTMMIIYSDENSRWTTRHLLR